jgi:dGTP triphosphohydrolase
MGNVIQFPSKNPLPETLTEEQVANNVDNIKYNHVNETINAIVPMLFHNMDLAGFDFALDEDELDIYVKDGSFLVESIRSMLCKFHDIEHPFQFIAENIFVSDGDGKYTLADKIELDLEEFKIEETEEDSES